MDRNDQQAIEQLFGKLAAVERQMPQRDAGAEAFIRDQISAQPGAPYYMAQTIVMQEQALQAAQARLEELEAQAAERKQSGGLFGSLFGSSAPAPRRSGAVPSINRDTPGQSAAIPPQPARGGGFLAGAAQTAMGVAGGVLLGNAIAGMLGSGTGEAQAAEAGAEEAGTEDMTADDVGFDDGGFDDGGFGDMDF